jgi:hypothetical protein
VASGQEPGEAHREGGDSKIPSGTLPNPISGHDFPISVYPDIEPDIGYDIADTRYRVFPDIGYPDIGTNPISGIPISGMSLYLISGMSRYRESRYRDQYRDIPISGPNVTISGH